MKGTAVVAEILKREGVKTLFAYPRNDIIEAAAAADIRPIIVRQERVGLAMADAYSRVSSGRSVGVFLMQHGPGSENAFGGVAQAYAESVPVLIIPATYRRSQMGLPPNFMSTQHMRGVSKWAECVYLSEQLPDALRRGFTQVRNGRPRPCIVEIPLDVLAEEFSGAIDYRPVATARAAPAADDVSRAAEALVNAKRPLLYAGQGVHYARAWKPLKELAELLALPVTTSLAGKSAFPENHPLSLGAGGGALGRHTQQFVDNSDLILGVGCSFTATNFGIGFPRGKTYIHATWDPAELNKNVVTDYPLIGDAGLALEALLAEVRDRLKGKSRDNAPVAREIAGVRDEWLAEWEPLLSSSEAPLTPYRVIREVMRTVDVPNTIVTHDSGSPRDQLTPFWQAIEPLSYIGWGKSTQLGYGLGLAMGAKVAKPDKLCINFWGDAAIGHTGMDFETCARERIPILSILLNNSTMAIELGSMASATEKFRSTDISGNYAEFARALGGYSERVTAAGEIAQAVERAVRKTQDGVPALLEFITAKERRISRKGNAHKPVEGGGH